MIMAGYRGRGCPNGQKSDDVICERSLNTCKLPVHCHDVCDKAPPTCIPLNCVEVLLNFITSNVHKTVVFYKTVRPFCSDVSVQNTNVFSSTACKTVCFKNIIMFHLSSVMLETSPFTVTPSTRLPSLSSP